MQEDNKKEQEAKAKIAPAAAPDEAVESEYFFPTHGVTVVATSIEEAEKKLVEIIEKRKLDTNQ